MPLRVGKNGVGITEDGVIGNALSLDNSKDHHVDCGTGLNLGKNSATMSVWFKTTSNASSTTGVIGKSVRGSKKRYSIYLSLSGVRTVFQTVDNGTYVQN